MIGTTPRVAVPPLGDASAKFFLTFGNFYACFLAAPSMISKVFSGAFTAVEGERHFTCAVHRVLHPRVHPLNLLTNLQTKRLTLPRSAFWSGRGRGVGWNDPAFCRTVRPKGFSEVVPAHTPGRKETMVLFPAI